MLSSTTAPRRASARTTARSLRVRLRVRRAFRQHSFRASLRVLEYLAVICSFAYVDSTAVAGHYSPIVCRLHIERSHAMFQRYKLLLQYLCLLFLALVSKPFLTEVARRTDGSKAEAMPAASFPARGEQITSVKQAKPRYGQLPIHFEPNHGQTNPHVKFIARGGGATTFLTATEAVFLLPIADFQLPNGYTDEDRLKNEAHFGLQALDIGPLMRRSRMRNPKSAIANRRSTITVQSAITMRLIGANPKAQIEGLDRLPGVSNYFIGDDPSQWRTNIPHFAKVRNREAYPGIDLVYYEKGQQLEFDFVISPGGNPDSIELVFEGFECLRLSFDSYVFASASC